MAQLLQAPTEGYEDAIVIPAIPVDNLELKYGLLTLVQNKQFFRHDKEDPHAHIRYFNKITFTSKFPNVSNTFKDLLRSCPHHGFSELHQLDTFYNALNSKNQDSLNSAAGVVAKVSTNTYSSGISPDVAELKDMVKALLLDKKSQNQAHATVKGVEESCVTCGGAHSYRNFPDIDGNVYRDNIQEFVSQASAVNYNQGDTNYRPPMMSNQIRPSGFPPVVENEPEATKETVHPTNNGSTEDVQSSVVQYKSPILTSEPELVDHSISRPVGVAEDVYIKVGTFHFSADFVVVNFDADPRVPLILGRSFLQTGRALIDVFECELTLRVGKESITFNLDQTSRYPANYNDMMAKRIDVIDMAYEEYSQEVLGFSDVIASGNPTPYYDPIISISSLTLTPFGNSDFHLEEVDAFLALEDDPTLLEVDQSYLDSGGTYFYYKHFSMMIHHYPLQIKEIICLKFVRN
nr:reverse transcriptase domain-containing protein [Tanacetum cinerariifolium]